MVRSISDNGRGIDLPLGNIVLVREGIVLDAAQEAGFSHRWISNSAEKEFTHKINNIIDWVVVLLDVVLWVSVWFVVCCLLLEEVSGVQPGARRATWSTSCNLNMANLSQKGKILKGENFMKSGQICPTPGANPGSVTVGNGKNITFASLISSLVGVVATTCRRVIVSDK